MDKLNSWWLAGLVCASASASVTAATVSSDFSLGQDGWTVSTFSDNGAPNFLGPQLTGLQPTFVASGGDPGGFIRITDPDNGWTYFVAPDKFRGNQSDKLGGSLSFSLQHSGGQLAGDPPHAVLKSGALVLVADAGGPPALTPKWAEYSVSLSVGNWHVGNLAGALATAQDLSLALGNLSGLFLASEFVTPIVETNGLDSVKFTAVPLPSALWSMLGALSLFGLRGKRRTG
jgi:hypothetical protein